MKLGTKSFLFGFHQFLIHPLYVVIAWKKLYKKFPNIKELICIFLHDLGYLGCSEIDGEEGDNHPYRGAIIIYRLFGNSYYELCIFHSETIALKNKREVSKLFFADKLSYIIIPSWLMSFLCHLSKEYKEYEKSKIHVDGFSADNFKLYTLNRIRNSYLIMYPVFHYYYDR